MKAMKYLLMFTTFCLTVFFLQAQTYKVQKCVIENGILKFISTDYDATTGKYSIEVNGVKKPLDEAYPKKNSNYAALTSWFIKNEKIIVNGQKYIKYGL